MASFFSASFVPLILRLAWERHPCPVFACAFIDNSTLSHVPPPFCVLCATAYFHSGADMTLATLSAWLPLPHPDASAETLQRILSERLSSSGQGAEGSSSSYSVSSTIVSLGPAERRRLVGSRGTSRLLRGTAVATTAARGGATRVFSRKMMMRGFTAPRGQQLDLLEQVRCVRLVLSPALRLYQAILFYSCLNVPAATWVPDLENNLKRQATWPMTCC